MKLKPTEEWLEKFIVQNQLQFDDRNWAKSADAPSWFKPSSNSTMYIGRGTFDQGSRYFIERSTGEFYIYEIQL
jgi:hypothetical protein